MGSDSRLALPHTLVGRGPHRVVVAHGWLGDSLTYSGIWPALDGARFSYAFVDCRGYGAARDLVGRYDLHEVGRDMLALADKLGWERFSVVGHSMSGMAVQSLAAGAAATRLRSMVGVCAVPASGAQFDDARYELFRRAPGDLAARRRIIDASTGERLSTRWLESMVVASEERILPTAMSCYLTAFAEDDFHQQLIGNAVPVKVFVGDHDRGVSATLMEQTWCQWFKRCELEVLGNAGHYPMIEVPIYFAAALEGFLSQH